MEASNSPTPVLTIWQYKWKFYVLNGKGKKTLEKESERWFNRRSDCIRASKQERENLPVLVGDGLKYKRVLVRRRSSYRTIDDVDERSARSAGERMLTLMYAEKIREKVEKLSRESCPGCELEDPSQLNHGCLILDFGDHLYMHFETALRRVEDEYILSKWEMYLETSDMMRKIHPVYLLKYRCLSWLNTDYKTTDWKSHVFRMCEEMGKFERIFQV